MHKIFTFTFIFVCLGVSLFAQTWTSQTSGTSVDLKAVQFLDANNGYACGGAGTVLKTTNGGTAWTPVNISTANPVNGISFINANLGWAVTGDPTNWQTSGSLWKTVNGGTSWTQQTFSGSVYAGFSVDFIDSTKGWVGFAHNLANGKNLYSTITSGASWIPNPPSADWQWLYGIDFINATTGWAVGDGQTDGTIFSTTDGGNSWTAQDTTSNLFLYGIDFPSSTNGFAVGDQGRIMATTDGGGVWNTQTSGVTVTLYGVAFVSTTNGWTVGENGKILMTSNGGSAWGNETSGTTNNLNGVFALDGTTAWTVGDGGVILKRSQPAGINEPSSEFSISAYPNPAKQFFTLQLPVRGSYDVVIRDITGRKILEEKNLSGKTQINCEKFAKGVYFVQASNGKNSRACRLIKKD